MKSRKTLLHQEIYSWMTQFTKKQFRALKASKAINILLNGNRILFAGSGGHTRMFKFSQRRENRLFPESQLFDILIEAHE